MPTLKQVTLTYKDKTTELIKDVVGFNFFGNVMIFDLSDGRTYQVRETANIVQYVVKGQTIIKNKSVKK